MSREAPHSSRRGMDKRLRGATFVLAVTSVMESGALEYTALMYTTAEYVVSEASENLCSLVRMITPPGT